MYNYTKYRLYYQEEILFFCVYNEMKKLSNYKHVKKVKRFYKLSYKIYFFLAKLLTYSYKNVRIITNESLLTPIIAELRIFVWNIYLMFICQIMLLRLLLERMGNYVL